MTGKHIYLINPKNPDNFWAMQGALDIIGKGKTLMPNAALLTLIALTPESLDIKYTYCDENVGTIDWDLPCDLVGITGYTIQGERMQQISAHFRKRGIPVVVGGVYATLNPEQVEPMADFLFLGEAEYTWSRFLREWTDGKAGRIYRQASFVDMKDSPAPDLSRIRQGDYHYFSVQTSRGCPNNCLFCDVVLIAGRKCRRKTITQIMQEVRNASACGAETVFFSDDNFLVDRKFTVTLLNELIDWNRGLDRPLSFSTQATVMIGDDEEVLRLLADARFSVIFLGLESLRKECLQEVNKGHLARYDPYEVIPRISSYGIVPFLGLIVGFDHDTPSVFADIDEFLEKTGSPIASISILNAPRNTPLYEKMKREGRLIEDFSGFWHQTTNIVPVQMSMDELHRGHKELFKKIYEPRHFENRMIRWMENVKYFSSLYSTRKKNIFRIFTIIKIFRHFNFRVPPPDRRMFWRIMLAAWRINPRLIARAVSMMVQYWHYRAFSLREAWKNTGDG